MTKEYKPIKIEHLIVERIFWIFTQVSLFTVVGLLISNTYGYLLGFGIAASVGLVQKFLSLRIYNLKRSINMLKFIDVLADQVTKANKEIDDKKSNDSK